jgi:hypothetical protein
MESNKVNNLIGAERKTGLSEAGECRTEEGMGKAGLMGIYNKNGLCISKSKRKGF